jgi:glycosyltransferase involved in cell wall biosynthesis
MNGSVSDVELSTAFVGTYPPTQCGLATFTAALRAAMSLPSQLHVPNVIRVLDEPDGRSGDAVRSEWVAHDRRSFSEALVALESFDLAVVQHEFGIYGGEDGCDVLELAASSPIPLVVVLHTALSSPTHRQRRIVERLVDDAAVTVTQTHAARDRILRNHLVDPTKVVVIPHGAPANVDLARRPAPRGGSGEAIVLTWGLIGPGKGIEHGIRAMARLRAHVPNVRYVVAGETHPKVRAQQGERYRESLQQLAADLGVEDHVTFDGGYRGEASLRALVRRADVVLLPYDSREQVTSGVLVEAIASAKPIVATRFPHAVEQLRTGSGLVVPHEDPDAIAEALERVLLEPGLAEAMSEQAWHDAAELLWPAVGQAYRCLATQVVGTWAAA